MASADALTESLVAAGADIGAERLCRHCGTPLGQGQDEYCCGGCAAAHAIIGGLGLEAFYARRTLDPAGRPLKPEDDEGVDYARHVERDARSGISTLNLMVDGVHCAACVWLIESVLARQPEVVEGRVNMTTRRLRLRWRGDAGAAGDIVGRLRRLGFRLVPYDPAALASSISAAERRLLRAMAVAGFAAANVMLLSISVWSGEDGSMESATRGLMHWLSALIAMPAIVYAGRPFFASALGALRARRTNMDVPISVAVLLTTTLSLLQTVQGRTEVYFDSAVTLVFFLLIGRYLDLRARSRARSAAEQLLALGACDVRVVRPDGVLENRPAQGVAVGEVVQVAAGERIGVDGRVVAGESEIDASLVSGEALPQPVAAGSGVFKGMVNLAAPLRVEVTATGEATLLAEIVRLMEAAERGRGRYVALADRVARLYAPVVHGMALLTFLGWFLVLGAPWQPALLHAVAVLIVTCPCALALAVPAVQVIAAGRLLRQGILLKEATALERLAAARAIVFDKTGTLTVGRPELLPAADADAEACAAAARIAASSRHPLAVALCRALPPTAAAAGVREYPGQGLSLTTAEGETRLGSRGFCGVAADQPRTLAGPELWLARPGRPPVRFAFADPLRADAAEVVRGLEESGLRVELLSGDRAATVAATARAAGIGEWRAEVTPTGKAARLFALRATGGAVAMVGDGLNDAPALAAADVSLSPASAVDISQTAADIVFQGARLEPVTESLRVARMAQRLVRENLGLALVYNALAVPLAVAGLVTPLVAAAAMSSSSIVVVLNALRLARRRSV